MQVTVIFGSNTGNRHELIEEGIRLLSSKTGVLAVSSSYYETEPWGFACNDLFLNRVVVIETSLPATDFLFFCLETEKELGRIRQSGQRYSSRTIDIDILFYDSQIIETPMLKVPHPRIAERNFVLTPLNEIMPEFIHPVHRKPVSALLSECADSLQVQKVVF